MAPRQEVPRRRNTLIALLAIVCLAGCERPDADRTSRTKTVDQEAAVLRVHHGLQLMADGDIAGALVEVDAAVRLWADPMLYYNRALTYHFMEQYELALVDYSTAIGLNPADQVWYRNRSKI